MKHLTVISIAVVVALVAATVCFADMASYQKRKAKQFFDKVKADEPRTISLLDGKLLVQVNEKGDDSGKSPNEGDSSSVHYSGYLQDLTTKFDSSRDRGAPADFAPNQVIQAWKYILQSMVEGDRLTIFLDSSLGYGARGSPPKIPPHSPLVFDMHLLKVKQGGKPGSEARKRFAEAAGKSWDEVEIVKPILA